MNNSTGIIDSVSVPTNALNIQAMVLTVSSNPFASEEDKYIKTMDAIRQILCMTPEEYSTMTQGEHYNHQY